ncbi:recombinase RecQ [Mycobacterium sp. GA-1841]|uniref:RecQ family ATP-dependent DNA helicase n=1 Tax=Mycobacterium sp. GA-1841 TaxID=1834154 RepID=UPI00096D272F|nr:RecQ family ATP-dependent DNA helicase [Mycobacterium sp. GA-1841]OMC40301.1 recombinase RecQ [Mycobacterium sp. GA-1841]
MSEGQIRAQLEQIAQRTFGWSELHPEQLAAMEAIMAHRDVLAVMSTGSGKSAIYQVPAVLTDGLTVVISPLISLQRDQIDHLADVDAPRAVAINSRQSAGETDRNWQAVEHREVEYVFLSPEQLAKDETVSRLAAADVSFIVVDEAHCVSAWGHDFRPDYLRLGDVIERLGRPVVAALTATASPMVRREIVEQLRLRDPLVIASGFDRENLRLEVERHTSDDDKRDAVLSCVAALDKPVLLYTSTRADAQRYADELGHRGLAVAAYHAGLRAGERDRVHRQFIDDEIDVVAATSAFGMGIDKPNVRTVVHASVPDSVDSYYQQIGRAGRDGEVACARLFYRPEDLSLGRFFSTHHPDETLLRRVYQALAAGGPKRLKDLRADLDIRGRRLTTAVNLLEQARAVRSGRKGFRAGNEDVATAVGRAVEIAESSERVDRSRVEMMRGYAETRNCRRQNLLGYFGEELSQPCGNCDRCSEQPDAAADAGSSPVPIDTPVEHAQWGAGVVMGGDRDTLTVLFDRYGYRTLSLSVIRENQVLKLPDDR